MGFFEGRVFLSAVYLRTLVSSSPSCSSVRQRDYIHPHCSHDPNWLHPRSESLLSLTISSRPKPPIFMPIDENLELATSNQFLRDNDPAYGGRSHYRSSSNSSSKGARRERAASEERNHPKGSAEWTLHEERSSRDPLRDSRSGGPVRRRIRSYSAAATPGPLWSTAVLRSLRAEQN